MMPGNRQHGHRLAGFTLVELLIVVVLLGILSAVAIPHALVERSQAVRSSLKANVGAVGMLIEYHKQHSPICEFPRALEDEWFASGHLPMHPDMMAGVPLVETVNTPGLMHPHGKTIQPGCPGAYWYNYATGAFRARVKPMESAADTLAFYNDVNLSGLHGLAATSDSEALPPGR